MSQLLNGSICLTDLVDKFKEGHSAFVKAQNGKYYFNFSQWLNDDPDKFGNHSSIMLRSSKDEREAEGKVYIGNAKKNIAEQPQPISQADRNQFDDLPF